MEPTTQNTSLNAATHSSTSIEPSSVSSNFFETTVNGLFMNTIEDNNEVKYNEFSPHQDNKVEVLDRISPQFLESIPEDFIDKALENFEEDIDKNFKDPKIKRKHSNEINKLLPQHVRDIINLESKIQIEIDSIENPKIQKEEAEIKLEHAKNELLLAQERTQTALNEINLPDGNFSFEGKSILDKIRTVYTSLGHPDKSGRYVDAMENQFEKNSEIDDIKETIAELTKKMEPSEITIKTYEKQLNALKELNKTDASKMLLVNFYNKAATYMNDLGIKYFLYNIPKKMENEIEYRKTTTKQDTTKLETAQIIEETYTIENEASAGQKPNGNNIQIAEETTNNKSDIDLTSATNVSHLNNNKNTNITNAMGDDSERALIRQILGDYDLESDDNQQSEIDIIGGAANNVKDVNDNSIQIVEDITDSPDSADNSGNKTPPHRGSVIL